MKKKIKRIISSALACVLLLALLPASALAAHWSDEYVQTAQANGWVDSSVAAGAKLTRGQFAVILWKALGSPAAAGECPFEDVTGAGEVKTAVTSLAGAGIVKGADGKFNPDATLSRQEGITMLVRAYGLEADDAKAAAGFADWADVASWAQDAMAAVVEKGIVIGVGNNRLAPTSDITLGEMAKLAVLADKAASTAIKSVKTVGFVDTDGAKISAISVEYNMDMTGANVSADTYDVITAAVAEINNGNGQPGDITKVYVDGKNVIIEVYTDYLCSAEQKFEQSMAAGVIQKADIKVGDITIPASNKEYKNYVAVESVNFKGQTVVNNTAVYGTYTIQGIEGFKFYTNLDTYGEPDGPAFHVEHCFDEKDGLYYDFDVSYALYVPENYKPSGKYAMVVVDNPAANPGTHPLASVLETRSPALLASDWAQDLVKEKHGLDGLIVVVPVVEARVDDNACTPGQYEALVALWDHIQEEYSIDKNHVYAIGQSVGGMVLMETNRNRDNYFAGILMFENQWAQNYYKDGLFARNMISDEKTAATAPMHYPRTDDEITWDFYYDEAGNKVSADHDPYNLYYLISDDNIMVMNRSNNNLSNNTWRELSYLYSDLVGYSIKQCLVDGKASLEEQEAAIQAYLEGGNTYNGQGMGLFWVTFENGSNGYSARKVLSGYEWLLSQTREDEMTRSKLDVNKPFETADEQIRDESRATSFTDTEGNTIYYLTAKEGAGTQFYNTSWLNLSKIADAAPGWLPEGMSWENGVKAAEIEDVTAINENGTLTAVAIKYSVDMKDIVINLKGDDIIGLDGNVRTDIKIILDPYEFYDADGNKIDCTIKNVYVNGSASVKAGAERGSGEGCYVIVELDTTSNAKAVGVIQRTTVRTNEAIATATAKLYK